MNYELCYLENLVEGLLNGSPDEDYQEAVSHEFARISSAVRITIFSCTKRSGLSYLRQHQFGILELFDSIFKAGVNTLRKHNSILLSKILDGLAKLLTEMKSRFADLFDWNARVPQALFPELVDPLTKVFQALQAKVSENGLPVHFTALFNNLIHPELCSGNLSFRRLDYLEELSLMLQRDLAALVKENLLEILLYLVSMNFNHPEFYLYCCSFIYGEQAAIQIREEKKALLHYLKKRVLQTGILTRKKYQPDLEDIKAALTRFINAEIEHINAEQIPAENAGFLEKHFKVNFTVRQLAIFINLQAASGIIVSDRPKLIHEYATGHFSTGDTEHISEKSFKNAYYGNTASDLDMVLGKLTEMLIIGQGKY